MSARRSAHTRAQERMIDPTRAVLLGHKSSKQNAQETARQLLRENGELLKLVGALLERTGPIEVDSAVLNDPAVMYEVERYDSSDSTSTLVRYVGKRVHG